MVPEVPVCPELPVVPWFRWILRSSTRGARIEFPRVPIFHSPIFLFFFNPVGVHFFHFEPQKCKTPENSAWNLRKLQGIDSNFEDFEGFGSRRSVPGRSLLEFIEID